MKQNQVKALRAPKTYEKPLRFWVSREVLLFYLKDRIFLISSLQPHSLVLRDYVI